MVLDWSPLWLSLRYAAWATLIAAVGALPLAWLMARRRFPGQDLLDSAASVPLMLPAAVLVYYLLAVSGRAQVVFSWRAAIVLSAVYTLPLILRFARAALESIDVSLERAAQSLGAGEWRVLWRITLPLAWRSIAAAVLAGFVRAWADFAVTALISVGAGIRATLIPVALAAFAMLYGLARLRRRWITA